MLIAVSKNKFIVSFIITFGTLSFPHVKSYVFETASRQYLRSAASHQLTVPSHRRVTYGGRTFAVAVASTCNSLPKRLRDPANSVSVFRRLLKTFFF